MWLMAGDTGNCGQKKGGAVQAWGLLLPLEQAAKCRLVALSCSGKSCPRLWRASAAMSLQNPRMALGPQQPAHPRQEPSRP